MADGYSVPAEVLAALDKLGNLESDPGAGAYTDFTNFMANHFGSTSGGTAKVPSFGNTTPSGGLSFWEAIDLHTKYADKSTKMSHGAGQLIKAIQDLSTAARTIHKAYVEADTNAADAAAQMQLALTRQLPQVNADIAAGAQDLNPTGTQNSGGQ
jgi:hypothetical protein